MTSGELRLELLLLGLFSAVWLTVIAAQAGLLPVDGLLSLSLYQLYGTAVALGWLAGNVYVHRRRWVPRGAYRKRLLLIYLVGPPAMLYLLRSFAPLEAQSAAPFVPLYGFGVYALLFFVPVSLQPQRSQPLG